MISTADVVKKLSTRILDMKYDGCFCFEGNYEEYQVIKSE